MNYFKPVPVLLAIVLLSCTMMPKASRRPSAEPPVCQANMKLTNNFSAEDIRKLSREPKVKTVEDMLGCLARDLDLRVMLVHTSIAAQNSDSVNPRALMFVLNEEKRIHAAFSVNSGEAHLVQAQAVEFLFNNTKKRELEYYDIDFSEGHPVVSPPNPELCMNCHGVNSRVPVGGPKPLFDRNPWARIVLTGSSFFPQNSDDFCPVRRKAHNELETQALRAYQDKLRYRSLQGEAMVDIDTIDLAVRRLNARRVATWISRSPDFKKYKYAIYGAANNCLNEPSEFFSELQIAKMTGVDTLNKKVQLAKTHVDLETYTLEEEIKYWQDSVANDLKNKALLPDLESGKPVYMHLPAVDGAGACRIPYQVRDGDIDASQDIGPQMEKYFESRGRSAGKPTVYEKYRADNIHGDPDIPAWRYVFETRGLDISDWDPQPTSGYGRSPFPVEEELLLIERRLGKDYAMLKDILSRNQPEACKMLSELARASDR